MGQIILTDFPPLNKAIPIPLYYQLKQFILKSIKQGDWSPGLMIPSEHALCEAFGISRPTVRQAIKELVSEGHLTRANRHVLVSMPKMAGEFFSTLQSFNEEMKAKGLTPSTQVLSIGLRECPEASKNLGVDGECICIERLRFADNEPIVWVETFLPPHYRKLLDLDFTKVSLYESVNEMYQTEITWAERVFEATVAGTREADVLNIKKGAPLCFVKTLTFIQNDKAVEFSIARYRGDKSKFMVRINM
ncbi:MAG: GntR family transcriptional regulator [Defluviitaleaceae bacterium]|nr:GntR family transcriptional regulator [Defluviitaleaceae bacterium]